MSNVMKERRRALGLSQARLAELAGVNPRQIVRYEAGEQQPVIAVAAAIARALGMSLSELAAEFDPVIDLSGRWWSAREFSDDGETTLAIEEAQVVQHNTTLSLAVDQTISSGQEGSGWRADLRLWDNEVLVGTYRLVEEGPRSWGTLLFTLRGDEDEADGPQGAGRWVGQSSSGEVVGGGAWLARNRDEVEQLRSVIYRRSP